MTPFEVDLRLAQREDSTVLISGERGVEALAVARRVHYGSRRRRAAFWSIESATSEDPILEYALFGETRSNIPAIPDDPIAHLRQIDGGTVVVENIGDLDGDRQKALLRFLEMGMFRYPDGSMAGVDVRIIATAADSLYDRVVTGTFLRHFYYRLNLIHLFVPPLRDRREEIPALSASILRELSGRVAPPPVTIAPEAMRALQAYEWPGNDRELRRVLTALAVARPGETIRAEHLTGVASGLSL